MKFYAMEDFFNTEDKFQMPDNIKPSNHLADIIGLLNYRVYAPTGDEAVYSGNTEKAGHYLQYVVDNNGKRKEEWQVIYKDIQGRELYIGFNGDRKNSSAAMIQFTNNMPEEVKQFFDKNAPFGVGKPMGVMVMEVTDGMGFVG